jgi:hypothetical protein
VLDDFSLFQIWQRRFLKICGLRQVV